MQNRINTFPILTFLYIGGSKRGKSSLGHSVCTLNAQCFIERNCGLFRYWAKAKQVAFGQMPTAIAIMSGAAPNIFSLIQSSTSSWKDLREKNMKQPV